MTIDTNVLKTQKLYVALGEVAGNAPGGGPFGPDWNILAYVWAEDDAEFLGEIEARGILGYTEWFQYDLRHVGIHDAKHGTYTVLEDPE
jgi:hypothetical protein